jgi:predicted pyridoxine 5'-phosphate oxidase superfamily flavin-nucleotide-binding protein
MNLSEIKLIIENNPVVLSTVMEGNKPNAIGVASVKVVLDDQILITDNYMNQTKEDIIKNNNVCVIVWDKELKGYKIIGKAEYFINGEWKKYVEQMPENNGLPAKGAILLKVDKIIPSA